MRGTLAGLVLFVVPHITLAADNELAPKGKSPDGWVLLFDGKTHDGWMTAARKPSTTPVEEGCINPHKSGGYMMIHKDKWENYVLSLDFKISKGYNSGTHPHVDVDAAARKRRGFQRNRSRHRRHDRAVTTNTGALYDLVKPTKNAMKPVGEWNHIEITSNGSKIAIELNGDVVTKADLDEFSKPNLRPMVRPQVRQSRSRSIRERVTSACKDHGSPCWYKNIKIKPLEVKDPRRLQLRGR